MNKFGQFIREQMADLPELDCVLVATDGNNFELFEERKWVPGRFSKNIGIDQPSHGVGQTHAHVYGRKGNEIVVVNWDGTGSHGTKGKLKNADAIALKARGFTISRNNIVEWVPLQSSPELLFG